MKTLKIRGAAGIVGLGTVLLLVLLVAFRLLVSLGNERGEATTPAIASPTQKPKSSLPTYQVDPDSIQVNLPCHTDLTLEQSESPIAEPTPEVVNIQLLERPYRMVPSNIVLRQNRWYKFFVTAGEEWHAFKVFGIGQRITYEIPPGGEIGPLIHAANSGVFVVENWRRMPESGLRNTITVVPEGVTPTSWVPSCAIFSIFAPSPNAALSVPFVIQGSFKRAGERDLRVTRIEAWSNGEQVGQTSREQFISHGPQSDFQLSIPSLPPGNHSLFLKGYFQNGTLAVTATMPLSVLPDPASSQAPQGFWAFIDLPIQDELLGLPVTIQGWAVIPNSAQGTGVGTVEIWNGSREYGTFLTEATYGIYRHDLVEALGDSRYISGGFYAQLHDLPAGTVDLHVYVRDRQSGDYVSPDILRQQPARRISLAEGKVTDAAWPVALAASPDGRLFFNELQTGNIRILQDGKVLPKPFATLDDVSNHAESGLLGLALHPSFPDEPYVFAMYTVDNPETGLPSGQRVVRFLDVENSGQDYTVILDGLPATSDVFHNGGRIDFGPDGNLYVSIGDIAIPELAQDTSNLAGSILRYNSDGSIPDDNPIPGSPLYAFGLRNVFGFAFQPDTGHLFATENGPGGFDEINKIEPGENYGWPLHMGVSQVEGFTDPVAVYGIWPEGQPIGPTGVAFSPEQPDLLLFCAYHGFYLQALPLRGSETSKDETMVLSTNCALDVTYGSDGWLYYSTVSAIYRARLEDLLRLHEQTAQ